MTVECLKNALALIENYFGRPLSTDERTARSQIYAAALKDIPDDVAAAALTKALTVCRYQNQLLVDWCAEIRKLQSAGQPTANDLWTQAIVAARKIERFLSTPSARRATIWPIMLVAVASFLSTPSARRATCEAFFLRRQLCISIHALREEGDCTF